MNLKKLREVLNLTQKQLSECSGVSLRMIQKYEQGDKDINKASGITLYKLAIALNCKMEDLIEVENENKKDKCPNLSLDQESTAGSSNKL